MIHWPLRRFGDFVEFRNGLNFGATSRGGDLPVVGVGDFQTTRLRGSEGLETVQTPEPLSSDALLAPGDLLFVRSNGSADLVGRCMLVESIDRRTTHSGFTIRARVTSTDLAPEWAFRFFQSGWARRALGLGTAGTNISNVSQGVLRSVQIPLPPIAVQVEYLRHLDRSAKAVAAITALITAKRTFNRALGRELLTGTTRLPDSKRHAWVAAPLGALFEERRESGASHLPLLAVTRRRGIVARDEIDRRDTSNADKSKYKVVRPGDIAYNTMRMWQGVSGLSDLEGIVSPAYTVVVPRGRLSGAYAKHLFKLPSVIHVFARHSQGLVDDTLALKFPAFARVRVQFPDYATEQARIVEILDALEKEVAYLIAKHDAYEQQQRGLMQRLLSGNLRIPAEPGHTSSHSDG